MRNTSVVLFFTLLSVLLCLGLSAISVGYSHGTQLGNESFVSIMEAEVLQDTFMPSAGIQDTKDGFTFIVNAYDLDWYNANGYWSPGNRPAHMDPNDINAEILFNGLSLEPKAYTPYIFGAVGNHPFVPGVYTVAKTNYPEGSWLPQSVTFTSTTFNYRLDFLGVPDVPLPVVLSSFSANLTALNYVKLNWTTQSELNMLGFRVYRSESTQMNNLTLITPILIGATNTSTTQHYTVTDNEVFVGQTYSYWLETVDIGNSCFHGPQTVIVTGSSSPNIQTYTTLGNAYPNPFRSNTSINMTVKTGESAIISIYNVSGQLVKAFNKSEGQHTIGWDGRDSSGNSCGSGIYFYQLVSPSMNLTKRMLIVK